MCRALLFCIGEEGMEDALLYSKYDQLSGLQRSGQSHNRPLTLMHLKQQSKKNNPELAFQVHQKAKAWYETTPSAAHRTGDHI